MIIYKATCLTNGKVYIGKTKKSLKIRMKSHIKKSKSNNTTSMVYFHRALRKYGPTNFVWDIIDNSALTEQELNAKEKYYVALFGSNIRGVGYNSTEGGDRPSRSGWKHKEETKRKIGAANRGLKRSDKQKRILSKLPLKP